MKNLDQQVENNNTEKFVYANGSWSYDANAPAHWINGHLYNAVIEEPNGKVIVSSEFENITFEQFPTELFDLI
jgi:hypothetical protein